MDTKVKKTSDNLFLVIDKMINPNYKLEIVSKQQKTATKIADPNICKQPITIIIKPTKTKQKRSM